MQGKKQHTRDDKETEDIDRRINELAELRRFINQRYHEIKTELQKQARALLEGENELRRMRTIKLEEKERNLDRILEVKELMAARGIRLNEYF